VRVGEVDLNPGVDAQLGVSGEFFPTVPGQRPAQLIGKGGDRGGDRVADGLAEAGQCRTVLDAWLHAPAVHAGQVQQHREARRSFDQRADRGPVQPDDEISLLTVLGWSRLVGS
jgi:hypothetical protein